MPDTAWPRHPICADYGHTPAAHPTLGRACARCGMALLHLAPTGEFVTREDGARGEVYDAYEPSMRAVAAAEDEDARGLNDRSDHTEDTAPSR